MHFKSKNLYYTITLLLFVLTFAGCHSEAEPRQAAESSSDQPTAIQEAPAEREVAEPQSAKLGTVSLNIGDVRLSSSEFKVESPQFKKGRANIEWLITSASGEATLAAVASTLNPNIDVLLGFTGIEAQGASIEGTFPLNTSAGGSHVTISLQFAHDGKASMFTFNDGQAAVSAINREGIIKVRAEGTGMYVADMSKMQGIQDDAAASFEIDIQAPRVMVDGELIRN